MSKEAYDLVLSLSWIVTFALVLYGACKGYSGTPRFDLWAFGAVLVLRLMLLGAQLQAGVK